MVVPTASWGRRRNAGDMMCSRGGSSLKFKIRLAAILFVTLYVAGISTGSFFVSVATVSNQGPPSMELRPIPPHRKLPIGQEADNPAKHSPVVAEGNHRSFEKSGEEYMPKAKQVEVVQRQSTPITPLKPDQLKLPTPIMVMGLMKAGTTSIYGYFKCGLDPKVSKLSHYDCNPGPNPERINMACGHRLRRNLTKKKGVAAFESMDGFHLYAELDAQERNGGMTLPQWEFLDGIYEQFPSATWILNLREADKWISSINRWKDLRQRFVDNPLHPVLPRGIGEDDADLKKFYLAQAQRIRDYVAEHPSLHLVEVSIDSPDAAQVMEDAFGITKECWGNRNVNDGSSLWKEH